MKEITGRSHTVMSSHQTISFADQIIGKQAYWVFGRADLLSTCADGLP